MEIPFKKLSLNEILLFIIAILLSTISFFEVRNYSRWDHEFLETKKVDTKQDSVLLRNRLIFELQIKPAIARTIQNQKDIETNSKQINSINFNVSAIKARLK